MQSRYRMGFFILLASIGSMTFGLSQKERRPIDLQVYMSILSKQGKMLTDYEREYMINLGHGDIRDDKTINVKKFHDTFFNALDNDSQAMKYYDEGRQRLDEEKADKKK